MSMLDVSTYHFDSLHELIYTVTRYGNSKCAAEVLLFRCTCHGFPPRTWPVWLHFVASNENTSTSKLWRIFHPWEIVTKA